MSHRYTPLTGEGVCVTCGEVIVEIGPVVPLSEPWPPTRVAVERFQKMEKEVKKHICGPFTDWDWARKIATLPHEKEDVEHCFRVSRAAHDQKGDVDASLQV